VITPTYPLILFSAGDLSGDMHASFLAARLKDEWARRHPDSPFLRLAAAGANHLRAAGVDIWEDTTDWGAIGIFEGIKKLPMLMAAKKRLIGRIRKEKPDIVIPVDYRGFNMSLLKDIRIRPDGSKQPAVYYIAPVLWWTPKEGKSRAALSIAVDAAKRLPGKAGKNTRDRFEALAELVDLALVAYPFSLDAYERAGVNFKYIGHPLGRIALDIAEKGKYLNLYRKAIEGKRLIGIAPGSRLHELKYHMPVLRVLLAMLLKRYPNLWLYCPVPTPALEKIIRDGFGLMAKLIQFVPDDCYDLMASSDLLIVKSGTSVQLALLLAVPAVTFYKIGSPWMVKLGKKLFQDIPFYTFPNLLAGREIVPELVQERFTLPNIYVACTELLDDPAKAGHMRAELAELRKQTMQPDPIGVAAGLICDMLEGTPSKVEGARHAEST
jgi:lipid-A-disaccharide synthase